jgi:WD40 repeat protein
MPCLANGGDDGKVQLWNLETLEVIRTFDAKAGVGALAFDGSILTAGLKDYLSILTFGLKATIGFIRWNLEDPSQPDVYAGAVEVKALGFFGMQPVAIVKISPPEHDLRQPATLDVVSIPDLQQIGKTWTSALARQGSHHDVSPFRFRSFALGIAGDVPCLAHAHGNSILLYKGDGSRVVLDLTSVQTRDPWENIVNCLAVGSYGGRPAVAAGSNSGAVRVWDVESLLLLAVFQDDDNYIDDVAIGELHGRPVAISGSRSNTIRILYPQPHGHVSNVAHQGTVWRIALFDGLLASWGRDQTLRLWDAHTMQPVAQPLRMASGQGSVAFCRLDDQTTLITGSDDGVARWDWRRGMRITEQPKTPVYCMSVAFRAGKMVILTGNNAGLIEVLDATSLRPVCSSLQATTDRSMGVQTLKVVSIGKRSQVLSAGSAKIIERWDLETLRPIGSPLKGHDEVIYEMASFTMGDAVMLASCSYDRTIRLWDLQSGLQHGSPLSGHQHSILALAAGSWKGDTVLVSGDWAGDLKIWNPATTELLLELSLDSCIYSLVMGEGKVFVGCGHGILQIELI